MARDREVSNKPDIRAIQEANRANREEHEKRVAAQKEATRQAELAKEEARRAAIRKAQTQNRSRHKRISNQGPDSADISRSLGGWELRAGSHRRLFSAAALNFIPPTQVLPEAGTLADQGPAAVAMSKSEGFEIGL